VTKWNAPVTDPEIVPELVRKAFKVAEYEKPGATHLEFSEDVAALDADADPLATRARVRRPNPDPASIERAADVLEAADRPIVLAGNGSSGRRPPTRCGPSSRNGPSVVATYMGKGAVSDADDHSLMTLDSGPDSEGGRAIERADCVLAVGYDVAEHDPVDWNPDLDTTVVHVDLGPAEVYRNYNPEVEVVSDPAAALQALTDVADPDAGSEWCTDFRERIVESIRRVRTPTRATRSPSAASSRSFGRSWPTRTSWSRTSGATRWPSPRTS